MRPENEAAGLRLGIVEPALAEALTRRVHIGAILLDLVEPGWFLRIDNDRLAMETCDRCILGQLGGDFHAGFRRILAPLPNTNVYSAARLGFTLHDAEQRITWRQSEDRDGTPMAEVSDLVMMRFAALAALWRGEVRRRVWDSRQRADADVSRMVGGS